METKLTSQSSSVKEHSIIPAEVKSFTIKNSKGTTLVLSNCGAAVVSLNVKGKKGDFSDIVLGYDDHPKINQYQ